MLRFAPSPTGDIHIGNLRAAIFNYIIAKQTNQKFLIRIEDTDFIFGREGYTVALESADDGIATFNTKTALCNPNNLNVSYSISPATDDATIDETNGVVRVKKRGTYTITAWELKCQAVT